MGNPAAQQTRSAGSLEPELAVLATALTSHGFDVEKLGDGGIDQKGHVRAPFLRLKGGPSDAGRLTDLLLKFYQGGESSFDTKLTVDDDFDDDATIDHHLEFDFTFEGADTLVLLPPEIFPTGSKEKILKRYRQELGDFTRFLQR